MIQLTMTGMCFDISWKGVLHAECGQHISVFLDKDQEYKDFRVTGYGTLSTAFIQKNQPDYVVILPYAGNTLGSKVGFTFVDDAVKTDEDNMIVDSTK